MTRGFGRRAAVIMLYLLLTLALAWGVLHVGFARALVPLRERGLSDLALTADRLTGRLQRYQDLAVLMSSHPDLTVLTEPGGAGEEAEARARADRLLLSAADRTTALNLTFLAADGRVLADADRLTLPEAEMAALRSGPIFRRALDGALGTGSALLTAVPGEPARRSYLFAAPSFDPGGGVRGVLVVAVDMDHVELAWRGQRPAVYFTDAGGRVSVTHRSELLFWQEEAEGFRPPGAPPVPVARRSVGGMEIWRADLSAYVPDPALRLVQDLPQVGMRATALIDISTAQRLARLQAAVAALVMLSFGAVIFWATERRRVLARANAQLESRVAARTAELSGTNMMLRREVAERQEAEAALKKAQAELVQAGKLSALGQMSAGLAHELNQPLMAIHQFAENAALFLSRGRPEKAAGNLTRISELSARMGRIIRNLRAFARQESEPARRVDLGQVIATALEMTEARLSKDGVTVALDLPEAPVMALAGEVRLAQVLVNLITNAADAMAGREERVLRLTLAASPRPTIRVADTGAGIAQPERIFDPYYTTKEAGAAEGMGLGLSISYGMVQSFGGAIRGANLPGGGAEFVVELAPVPEEMAAE